MQYSQQYVIVAAMWAIYGFDDTIQYVNTLNLIFQTIIMEKYKKVKIVGKGSFGYAVLVESKRNKKQYIMKIIDISKMDQKQIEEALMEVHLLKVMRYPYVVTYRESFMEKMCLCIVMDYCQGGDMFHKIAKQKQLGTLFPQHQIVTWLVQMALAMNYVHDKKILHRDLKTQNIFLTSKGDIKIGDFGIARVLQHTYDCANTAIGTPYYLSPEICQERPYNQKSDIWSLGCIFYEIATLNHAFDAQNMKSLIQKILKGTYPPLPDIYSNDLKNLLSQMLIKDPNKRPSIKKILEMPFMKAKINELFSSTMKIHELKLQKQSTLRSSLYPQDMNKLTGASSEAKKTSKDKSSALRKKEDTSKDKKLDVVSKNNSSYGFKKKVQPETNRYQLKGISSKRTGSREDSYTNRSQKYNGSSQQKSLKSEKEIKNQSSSHKKSTYEEEETLEEQGYGVLIRDMKRCIKGESSEQIAWKIEDGIAPKYLEINKVPGVQDQDTRGSKIQALRAYLQKQIGDLQFVKAYSMIQDEKDDDYKQVKGILGQQKSKFIPLIVQLIVCEDSYY